jgi:hypothetical protein
MNDELHPAVETAIAPAATDGMQADLLPEQVPDAPTAAVEPKPNPFRTTEEAYSTEITIVKAVHHGTKDKKYWAIVLGQPVGFEFDIRSKTKVIEMAKEELERIRKERFEAITKELAERQPVSEPAPDAHLEMEYERSQGCDVDEIQF